MIEATSCGGVVIFRGKILVLYKNYKNKYEGWVLPKGDVYKRQPPVAPGAFRRGSQAVAGGVPDHPYAGGQGDGETGAPLLL